MQTRPGMRGFRANSAENIRHRGLSGGAGWIRTPGTARASMGENSAGVWRSILPDKSIRAGENLFVWNSTLLRLSPVRLVRQFERRCSATSNIRPKLQVQNPSNRIAGLNFYPASSLQPCQASLPQEQWRIPSLLGVRMSDRAVTSVRELASQWLLRSYLDSSNSGDVGERRM
jgi:hypothetical protein